MAPPRRPDADGGVVSMRQHHRVWTKYGKAADYNCAFCYGRQAAEWAWLHGTDPESPRSYVPLCHSCHVAYDHAIRSALATVTNRRPDVKLAASARIAAVNQRRWGGSGAIGH